MADTVYVNDDGIKANLDSITGKSVTSIGAGKLRLFKNNVIVSNATVIANLTEADFAGYAAVTLTAATWAAAAAAAHVASSQYGASVTFSRSTTGATQNIYGWYLTDAGGTKLYACANFTGAPIPITNSGDNIAVTPTLTDQSLN